MISGENLQSYSNLLDRFDTLLERQEEIIDKLFKAEADLAKLRIGYLDEYFDAYSSGLNNVARKTSDLNDTFLVLEHLAANMVKDTAAAYENSERTGESINARRNRTHSNDLMSSDDKGDQNGKKKKEKPGRDQEKFASDVAALFAKTKDDQRAAIDSDRGAQRKINARQKDTLEQVYLEHSKKRTAIEQTLMDIEIARYDRQKSEELQLAKMTDLRLDKQLKAAQAESSALDLFNEINAELAYAGKEVPQQGEFGHTGREVNEAGVVQAKLVNNDELKKSLEDEQARRLRFIKKQELKARRDNNGVLSEEEATKIQQLAAQKFKLDEKNLAKLTERRAKLEAAQANAAERKELREGVNTLRTAETFEERKAALYDLTHNEAGEKDVGKALSAAMAAFSDLAKQLEKEIDEVASFKGGIDTRLAGSNHKKYAGSYWDQLVRNMTEVGAINPFFKQKDFATNIDSLVQKGIAFNIEQRAFLMTITGKIATTFDASHGTLLKLIRIQQQDSTAGRLGMEAALNAFLNNMYETTEYLSDVAKGVRDSLYEMEALMDGAAAAEVEYQVQKWFGSLYSVGMSDTAINSISTALGQIAAGQLEGLTGGGAGNLLVMAANDAGLSIADILINGIDAKDTNKLLQAIVNYLSELSETSKDNQVVQQQLANVFGVKASDLRAATNLSLKGSVDGIYNNSLSYDAMLKKLEDMAATMMQRTSMAELMTNFWENGKYTLASSMASNPVSYFIYKMAKVVDDAAGGIDLPFLNVMGFGVDLNTTVSDLMRVAAVGGGLLGSIGPLISGLGNSFSGRSMLHQLGIKSGSGLSVTPRGDGAAAAAAGGASASVSESGYAGNSSGSDIKNSTIQGAEDSKKQQMIEAKEEEEANQVNILNTTVLKIYELLDDVANGKSCFRVKVDEYGLYGLTKSNAGQGAISTAGAQNSINTSGTVDLGGWTMF